MSRLALSPADKSVRDWFVSATTSLGCVATVDAMGNIFAVRPGRRAGPPTFAGSHLDTQPSGGRYDGILGVVAGVEMLKVLAENEAQTEFPVGVVNWTNEEGARFPVSMLSSGVWAGAIPLATAHTVVEVGGGGATVGSELAHIGYLGATPAHFTSTPMGGHFELHIEQGPILESSRRKVGAVVGAQSYKWFGVTVRGREAHTGTTPLAARADALLLAARADALLLAARLVVHAHRVAAREGALASTGVVQVAPGSTNTVPGEVKFSLDVRAPRDETVERVEAVLKRDSELLARGVDVGGLLLEGAPVLDAASQAALGVEWRTDFVSPATTFDPDAVEAVRQAARSVLGSDADEAMQDMASGAGHDSVYASTRCPTAMIFVPCRNGVSHHPEEWTSDEDCAIGAEVLCRAVVGFDRWRAAKADREAGR